MPAKITHVFVLMLENRAFDHMLGFLRSPTYAIDGLTGAESNPLDPHHAGRRVAVSADADYILPVDPGHGIADVNVQIFANTSGPPPSGTPSEGFVFSYSQQPHVTPAMAPAIMKCFAPDKLPALSRLAQEFALCDRWFSSVPGPTWPNRLFAHCATSKGYVDNSAFNNYDMRTVFEQIGERGLSWKIYFHDAAQALALKRIATPEQVVNFLPYRQFSRDAKQGALPNYTFIEPRYFSAQANDQHPPHDVAAGEALIADVYNIVRGSSAWNESLLLIVYDEHGGTYDHVLPPAAIAPDAHTGQFAFDRYGVRVPAVVVSPHIPRGTIVHDRVFDHASIPATLRTIFGLDGPLTARDAAAASFDGIASLSQPRSDTPAKIGTVIPSAAAAKVSGAGSKAIAKGGEDGAAASSRSTAKRAQPTSAVSLSDWQRSLVDLADSLDMQHRLAGDRGHSGPTVISDDAARRHVEQKMRQFIARAKAARNAPKASPRQPSKPPRQPSKPPRQPSKPPRQSSKPPTNRRKPPGTR